MSSSILTKKEEKMVDTILAYIRANEKRRLKYEAEHPDLCAYDRLEQSLRNLLTGEKLPFSYLNGREVVIRSGCKITNTSIKRLIEVRRYFTTDHAHPHSIKLGIDRALRVYDEELGKIATKQNSL